MVDVDLTQASAFVLPGGESLVVKGSNSSANISLANPPDGSQGPLSLDIVNDAIDSCKSSGGGGTSTGPASNVVVTNDNTLDITSVSPNRVVLVDAGSWSAPANTQSVSYAVVSSGDQGVSPTVTVNNGTTPLFESESGAWSIIQDQDDDLQLPIEFTSSAGDILVINYTLA